jgi:hypothetical protein
MRDNFAESLDRQLGAYESMVRQRDPEGPGPDQTSAGGWLKFAAATGASLVSATSADAAIVHVMPASPIRVEIPFDAYSDFTAFDLNNDAVNDMQLGAVVSAGATYYGFRYFGSVQGQNGLALLPDPGDSQLTRQLAPDEVIPAVTPTEGGNVLRVSATSLYQIMTTRGNWSQKETGIAGFVFGPAGAKKAGWIQLRTRSLFNGVDERLDSIEALQWAYESVPGVSIKAGQTANAAIPGDYNNNGTVGQEDYTLWKNTFNSNVTAGTAADGNSNGKVDAADYTYWRDRFGGAGSGALAAQVPEPATVTLGVLALGAAGVAALRRRPS